MKTAAAERPAHRRIYAGLGGQMCWLDSDSEAARAEMASWFAGFDTDPQTNSSAGVFVSLNKGPEPRLSLILHDRPCDPAHMFVGPEWRRFQAVAHPTRRLYSDTHFGDEPVLEANQTELVILRSDLWPLYLYLAHGWLLMQDRTLVGVHSAVAAAHGTAIVLVGASGAGKSTLSMALVSQGADFYSDEWVFFRLPDLELSPWPRSLHLRPGGLEALGVELPAGEWYETRPGDPKYCIEPPQPSAPCPRDRVHLLFLDGFAEKPALTPIGGAEASRRLLTAILYADPGPFERLSIAADLVNRYPSWNLEVGKPDETAAMLIKQIGRVS